VPKLPPEIAEAIERVDRILTHPHEFPELAFKWLSRKRRSQRLEAIARSLKAQFLRTDLPSMRVGLPRKGSKYLEGLPVAQMAAWAGDTYSRTSRAIRDVTKAGYQVGHLDKRSRLCAPQPRQAKIDPRTGERTYVGHAAVRKFTPRFLRRLGMALRFEVASKRAANKRRKQAEFDAAAIAEAARLEVSKLHKIQEARLADAGIESVRARSSEENKGRRFNAAAMAVRQEHPEWSSEEQRAEAWRRVESTGPPE
jgi:hypothetical protein